MDQPAVLISLLCGAFALYAGFNQLVYFSINPEHREELYFAAACLFYFLFNLSQAVTYASADPVAVTLYQACTYATAIAGLTGFYLFTYYFFHIKNPPLFTAILIGPCATPLGFVGPLAYDPAIPDYKTILGRTVFESARHPLLDIPLALEYGVLLTLLYFLVVEWRRHRAGRVLSFVAAYALLAVAFANDVLFVLPINLGDFGALPLVMAMSYSTADRMRRMFAIQEKTAQLVVETHSDYHKKLRVYADELEHKVYKRTKELMEATKQSQEAYAEIDRLNELTREITSTTSLDDVLDRVLNHITNSFGITSFWLVQIDPEEKEIFTSRIIDFLGVSPPESLRELNNFRTPLTPEAGLLYAAFRRRRPVYLARLRERRTPVDQKIARMLNLKGLLVIPLVIQNRVRAMACFSNYESRLKLRPADIRRINRFCSQIAGAIYSTSLIQQVERERERSEKLLRNILPDEIAEELKQNGEVRPVFFENASVLFTDLVGFTRVSEQKSPGEIIGDLNAIFLHFDRIADEHNLEKIKTIGDAYMAAGGLPRANRSHPVDVCLAALEIVASMNLLRTMHRDLGGEFFELRVGIHTGPLMAGVVGKNKFTYDIFGDTVNVASRMESGGQPGRINISEDTYRIVAPFFECEYRGELNVKNRGRLHEYFLNRIRPDLAKDEDGLVPNEKFRELYEILSNGEITINPGKRGLLIRERDFGDFAALELEGEINLENARGLTDRLAALLATGRQAAILDLRLVEFIDSTGVGILINAHRQFLEKGARIVATHLPEKIKSIFTGIGVSLYDEVADAVLALQNNLRRQIYPEDLDFNINFQTRGGAVILRLAGKLNYESARILRERLEALGEGQVRLVVLNCRDLKSIDSSGFGVILFGHNRFGEKGGSLRLTQIPPAISELFQFSRLDGVLSIFPDEESALGETGPREKQNGHAS